MAQQEYQVQIAGELHQLELKSHQRDNTSGQLQVVIDGAGVECTYQVLSGNCIKLEHNGRSQLVYCASDPRGRFMAAAGCHAYVEPQNKRRGSGKGQELPPEVTPPMPSVVVKVLVSAGQKVEAGEPVVVVSAMKMETTLKAPREGVVTKVGVAEGDRVNPGEILVTIE